MKDKMTIIFFSGTLDKAIAALTLATTAAAMDMEVEIFFTFWGLNFLKRGRKYAGKNLLQKMMEFMMPARKEQMPISTLNMLGAGPAMMKKLMTQTHAVSLEELTKLAKELKVKFYACSTSCGIMGLDRDNMIDEVDDIVGATAFLSEAQKAKINFFI